MTFSAEKTGLWLSGIGIKDADQEIDRKKERLRSALSIFRERASTLTARIAATFPELTVHDITHLEALWETADLIAGEKYPLNPLEAFVFGGAVLLHDAAHCFEAYKGGRDAVRETVEWKDAMATEVAAHPNASTASLEKHADFTAIRLLHANQAAKLGEQEWVNENDGSRFHLIEDTELRSRYGSLIGQIAASHNWNIEDVHARFRPQINAPGDWPAEWRVDPVKIACLLRCADAAHIDNRRAPDFLYALIRRSGVSLDHWKAQNWLSRADIDQSDPGKNSIVITSSHPFSIEDASAWWVAFDAISLLDSEIRSSNSLLMSRAQKDSSSPPFAIRRVSGANSPSELSKSVETVGWEPTSATIHVGNLEKLVHTLGGENLYGTGGDKFSVVLRELIQNARDAITAREALHGDYGGKILIKIRPAPNNSTEIEVRDNGMGMSERTMTGPLLDFGMSFWSSELVKSEFPGLRSSGFRSVGRFGIGFYSIFMVATSVKISSRRFDAGLADVVSLRFNHGLTLRPILSRGADQDYDVMSSTSVTFTLSEPFDECVARHYRVANNNEVEIPIKNCLSVITAGLDVAVWLQIDDKPPVQVHEPISKLNTEDKVLDWIKGITFVDVAGMPGGTEIKAYVRDNAKRIRPIVEDGRILGLAALIDLPRPGGFLTTGTVGGLSHTITRGAATFMGFLENTTNSAKREVDKRSASRATLQAWANEQIDLLRAQRSLSPVDYYWIANQMANSDIDPIEIVPIPIVMDPTQVQLLSLEQAFELLKNGPIACAKTRIGDMAETHIGLVGIENLPTMRPLDAGNLISLAVENGRAKNEVSLLGCLDRYVLNKGRSLSFSLKPTNLRSVFSPIDAFIITMV